VSEVGILAPGRTVPGPGRGDVGCAMSVPDFHHTGPDRNPGNLKPTLVTQLARISGFQNFSFSLVSGDHVAEPQMHGGGWGWGAT